MRHLLFIAILAIWPMSLLAEPALVQTGEHATFTRVVTPMNGNDWSVTHNNREVILSIEGANEGFDTSTVFDLIPKDRIAAVTANANQLNVTLACDCVVSAVTERGLYVVIDVAETSTGLESPSAMIAQDSAATAIQTAQNPTPAPSWTPSQTSPSPPTAWQSAQLPQADQDVVKALQDRLTAEVETAAQRGVLSPSSAPFTKTAAQQSPINTNVFEDTQPDLAIPVESLPAAAQPQNELSNLRISTSRDLPQTFRELTEILGDRGQVCPPDAQMAVASWGDERPFAVQMSEARQGLYGEFDRINPDVVLRLARTYLYFGFGAEARDVLELHRPSVEDQPLLMALATLMDSDTIPTPNPLSGLAECNGETALWAILAAPMPPKGALPEPDSALRSLSTLPSHLRILLAPKLHKVLLAYGDPDGATASLRTLQRMTSDLPAAAKIAQAKSDLEQGNTKEGKKILADVVDENAGQSPEALIALVDAKLKAGEPISADTAQLVEAYALELRNSELGPDLRRLQLLSLAQSGQFDAAFAQLNETIAHEKATVPPSTRHQLVRALTEKASDIVFLDHALEKPYEDLVGLPQNDLLNLAQRFLTLGFPGEAERMMEMVPTLPRQREKQLLSARISLAMNKPFRAQADLLNLTDDTANALRADAKRMTGAHDEAHVLYDQIDRPQDAAETAWLAEDWRQLTSEETPVFGPATTLPPSPELPSDGQGVLERSNVLLEQSTLTRQTLNDLLGSADLQLANASE